MNLATKLTENTCYIVPSVLKRRLHTLISKQKLANVKVLTFDEVEDYLSFSYTPDALYFLTTTCHLSIPEAEMYMDAIRYIKDQTYQDQGLEKLVIYYRILKEYHKLIFSDYGTSFFRRFPVKILGFDYLTKKQQDDIEILKELTEVETISLEEKQIEKKVVYEFDHIREEVEYLAFLLATKIKEGVDPSHLYLIGLTEEYRPFIQRIFSYYHLPYQMMEQVSLFETEVGRTFLKQIQTLSPKETIEQLKKKYSETKEERSLISACVDIINKYCWYEASFKDLYEYIKEDVRKKQVSLSSSNLIGETTLLHNHFDSEDYVFIVGANQGSFPTLSKDEDYITDQIASITLKDDSVTENKNRKKATKAALLRIPNLYLSYKKTTDTLTYYPSSILKELSFKVEKPTLDLSINYSGDYLKLRLGCYLDDLKNYNVYHPNITLLSSTYGISDYLSYDHQFHGLSEKNYQPRLSYTSMSMYFECAFKYYLNYLLSLNEFEESFAQKVGNIYHYILTLWDQDSTIILEALQQQESEVSFDVKEQVWWERLKEHLFYLIKVLKDQSLCTDFRKEFHEKEIVAKIPGSLDIQIKGIIDKIMMYEENGFSYVALVDYKTGSPETSLKNLKYGFDMQLPFYLYLLHQSEEFKDSEVVGFYLQKCLDYKTHVKHHEVIEDHIKDSLKVQGYSTNQEGILSHLDKTYQQSEWIKNLKVTKNGFSAYAKMISDMQIKEVVKQMEDNIKYAYTEITKGNFEINPKVLNGHNKSCTYCPFKDICFKTNNDTVYLGGESDE